MSSGQRARAQINATSARSCQARKLDGGKCRSRPTAGSRYCFFHDTAKAEERAAAQSAGGQRNRITVLPRTAPDVRLRDARDLVELLAQTINHVLRGEIDPKVANAVGYLGGLLMKALHEAEIENRLAVIEAAVKRQPATPEFNEDQEHSAELGTNGYK